MTKAKATKKAKVRGPRAKSIRREIERELDIESQEDDDQGGGFNQYRVKWNDNRTSFTLDVDGVHFYGWWRKRGDKGQGIYCVDLYAKRGGAEFSCDSISYDTDPRDSMRSLDADICAAANKWFAQRVNDNVQTIDDLMRRAKQPTIRIRRLETIDRLIMRLKEFRDTAITCGGTRLCELHGDDTDEKAQHLYIDLDVTPQAYALNGKPPSLKTGGIYDRVADPKRKNLKKPATAVVNQPSADNVKALVEQLNAAKGSGDKSQQRKIRAMLRRMGHRGGSKGVE